MHANLIKHVQKTFGDTTSNSFNVNMVNEQGDAGNVQASSESEFQDAHWPVRVKIDEIYYVKTDLSEVRLM